MTSSRYEAEFRNLVDEIQDLISRFTSERTRSLLDEIHRENREVKNLLTRELTRRDADLQRRLEELEEVDREEKEELIGAILEQRREIASLLEKISVLEEEEIDVRE